MPLPRGRYLPVDAEDLYNGGAGQIAASNRRVRLSIPRMDLHSLGSDAVALATGVMLSIAVPLYQGDSITNLGAQFGGTAAGTPSHWWLALYSNAATPALLGQTADQLTAAIAADSVKELAITGGPIKITQSGIYFIGVMVAATTPPTMPCRVLTRVGAAAPQISGQVVIARTSGSALTTTAPGTITAATNSVNQALVWAR